VVQGQPPADGCAVVLDVDRVLVDPDGGEEPTRHLGEGGEGVVEVVDGRRRRSPEADVVRCDDAVPVGQGGDEVPEHVGAGGVPVQEQDDGCVGGARFPVEHVEAVDGDGAVVDGGHD
jgi:hypothetical protein